jgi:hypothetical protein
VRKSTSHDTRIPGVGSLSIFARLHCSRRLGGPPLTETGPPAFAGKSTGNGRTAAKRDDELGGEVLLRFAAPDQRSGVFGTAQQMASCLKSGKIAAWVTPTGGNFAGDRRPHIDSHVFVLSSDTLYSLSKEGKGTAGPLVTAPTAATIEGAEQLAKTQAGGRLATRCWACSTRRRTCATQRGSSRANRTRLLAAIDAYLKRQPGYAAENRTTSRRNDLDIVARQMTSGPSANNNPSEIRPRPASGHGRSVGRP